MQVFAHARELQSSDERKLGIAHKAGKHVLCRDCWSALSILDIGSSFFFNENVNTLTGRHLRHAFMAISRKVVKPIYRDISNDVRDGGEVSEIDVMDTITRLARIVLNS